VQQHALNTRLGASFIFFYACYHDHVQRCAVGATTVVCVQIGQQLCEGILQAGVSVHGAGTIHARVEGLQNGGCGARTFVLALVCGRNNRSVSVGLSGDDVASLLSFLFLLGPFCSGACGGGERRGSCYAGYISHR